MNNTTHTPLTHETPPRVTRQSSGVAGTVCWRGHPMGYMSHPTPGVLAPTLGCRDVPAPRAGTVDGVSGSWLNDAPIHMTNQTPAHSE